MPANDRFTDDPGFVVVGHKAPVPDRLTDDPGFELVDHDDSAASEPYHADDFEADPGFAVVKQASRVQKDDAARMAHIKDTDELQQPADLEPHEALGVDAATLPFLQANQLVAGMDEQINQYNLTPELARRRASRMLSERPSYYDHVGQTPATARLNGIQLDLGAGGERAPGFLGIDLQTYGDYGIALHDLSFGLSDFPDGCAKAVRLVNSLWHIVGMGSPRPLLDEIQRVLCIGGELVYEDSRPLRIDGQRWPYLGLKMTFDGQTTYDRHTARRQIRQVFVRVHPRVPAFHGAEADFAPMGGALPIDLAMALNAYNTAPAHLVMANLVNKAQHKTVKIAKSEPMKQVVIGVVLSPEEMDSQGDVISAEDIERAAHGYMGTSRIIGSEHGAPIEAHPVESYIAPQDLVFDGPDGKTTVTKGSWVLGVKVNDKEQWQKVMNDGYTGFSVGGFGLRDDV